ncbi:conserved hypothetical protein [Chaetomium globosum CBS 148.51]|uniref:Serine/threonine-protein kinase TOR n=1 Tax=Chaetomium globosum (strain ATCC 6205 / CBS 148.51 / DSM 1962 / NBRC 6347 / NRRL 1970) TaxID=306901 RepID=Q2GTI4_CHAGB|nr:uncharacterized protein CHGG_08720 [Chaetomium globosum CBS 148.51]EAQ84706.1 conserved hypothetical protein [Chaetomium globosum CBS 148.51]
MSIIRDQAATALDQYIKEVRNRSYAEDQRKRAARQVRDLVNIAKQEQFQRFFDTVNQRTMALIQGTDTYDKMGGVYILDALVDFEGIEPALKYSRFQQYIGTILRGKDLNPMQPAAVVLGKMCKPGGSLISELVDAEMHTALEWLQSDRVEERRYSAVLVLRELARNAPTLMYPYVGFVFDQIWIGLRDPRHLIRATSSETVSACFKIIRERDQEMKQEWMDKMFTEAVKGLKTNTVEYIHASLLVLKELLEQGGMYMQNHYQNACEIVFRHKDARDSAIRKTVVFLIPDLANYAPTEFGATYLHKFMVYLSSMLKKEKERNDAFLAIGNIANSVKSSIAPYLDGVLIYVREGLSVQSRKRGSVDPVFDCISRLAVAVGQTLSKYMEALLDPIFACELTPKLTQALVDMAFYIPPVKGTIQERLLNMLSKVLCGEPFRPLGAPHPNPLSSIPPIPKDPKDPSVHERGKAEVKLALNTLGSFDFSGHVLNEFVRDVAIKYVEDDDPEIREAAALTCCQLYVRDPIVNQTSYHALQVVADVVEKLLTVGVSDPEPKIRRTVLAALDERFDQHLAKAENIRTLFFALHDEQFAVREVAVSIIGRLARHNPAYVIPQLRKTIIQMLTELEYTDVARSKEESSKLLSLLTQHAQDLVKPYVSSITEVLLPKASDPTPSVAATILQAIGELCTVGGAEMLAYKDTLMPIIIDALQDQSAPIKREAALHTLGQLASNAGYVIKPYLEYPQLLEILQSIIRGEPQHGPLRQETIKLMGILGALDPYKHQQVEERTPQTQRRPEATQLTDVSLMMGGLTPSQEDYYPTVVINALLQILKDQSLLQWHGNVVDAIMSIFITLGLKCVQFLDRVVPAFIAVIRASSPTRLDYYFNHLSRLVGIVRQHIRVYLPDIIEVLQEFWNTTSSLQTTIMALIESISRSLEGEFKIYLAQFAPIGARGARKGHKYKAQEPSLRVAALDTLCALMLQLGRDYLHFEHTVEKTITMYGIQHSNYDKAVEKLRKGEALPQNLAPRFEDNSVEPYTSENNPPKKLDLNPVHLKQAWETKGKATKDDWHEWFRKFSTTLLSESPNHSLRACASLASNYQPLARELFNSAFVSCWSELYDSYQEELITNIENTIKSENVPPDLLGQLLNLAEFMEHDDKALPIDIRILGREAARCHAYAKALHYKELEFLQDHNSHAVEALIVINNQLQQSDAAIGILRKVKAYKDGIQLRESWFEKLERWDEALNFYCQRERELPEDQPTPVDIVMGKMRCYHALGEWDSLASLAGKTWANSGPEIQRRIAPLATTAAWGLGKWDSMDTYLQSMKRFSPDRAFFGAILALHRNQFREALGCIEQAREGLDTELSALVSESYNRAYQVVVRVQMLAELEELIVYKQCGPEKRATLRATWETRLKGCQRNVEVWQRTLRLRSLVLTPQENMHMWTKFANLCRKSGRMGLAEKSLKQLIDTDAPLESVIPYWFEQPTSPGLERIASPIVYAVLKFQWEIGQQPGVRSSDRGIAERTLYCLHRFTEETAHRVESARLQLNASAQATNSMGDGLNHTSVDTWLEVIPQLIARINQPNRRVQASIHALLSDVGRAHPQALVYPLTVAMKSRQSTRRSKTASSIMESMRQHSPKLVEQADIVSRELIRVAVLWHELWHEGLEEASRLYFGDHNIPGMFDVLEPLHDLLEKGPTTLREISFTQTFGRDLSEAREWCRQYRHSQDVNDISQAWDLYYQVFRRISRQLPQMTSLELTYCSPDLLQARDLEIAVPGTYRSGQDIVKIMGFEGTVSVISSKQRPRKLAIIGGDGKTYSFLLKGHEDIRQDERVMQLFGLCNTLLANDSESYKRHLNIQRYPAIPLSQNSGLLGWVPNSDTVHQLIREYRESRKILLNIEHRIMLQMAPDYDNLTLMQKVEVFGYALDNTTGQDLYRVLWLKSKSSEAWLDRRTNYTRSLGVMSMVGYILGLGDRHPSNLMLDRITGKIIHIDFGDCFEVAMKREKYPERVPFRLTRMLTYAMEVSNIEGSFRTTCEHVMRVLRDNKESVMAVLEAFIHDPLLTWRLTNPASPPGPHFNSEREQAIAGPQAGRARRPSVLDGPVAPTEFLAAQTTAGPDGMMGAPPGARGRARTNSSVVAPSSMANGNGPNEMAEVQNARAVEVLDRVAQKLTGRDFKPDDELTVNEQVNKLIIEATKLENLCQHYIGWCSFW